MSKRECENWIGSSGHVNMGCGVVLRGRTKIGTHCSNCGKPTGITDDTAERKPRLLEQAAKVGETYK